MIGGNSKKRGTPDGDDPLVIEQEKKNDKTEQKQSSTTTLLLEKLSSRFPSLPFNNEKSSIPFLGLYFAASWCPDVQAATPAVQEFAAANQQDICIVYVSSDSTVQQMKDYLPSCMVAVPFEREDERANLKRHFGACAGKERESLGMTPKERKFGIPTLIVLDQTTGKVVTSEGVDDIVKSNGESVIEKWKAMISTS